MNCEICGKPQIPPGTLVLTLGTSSESPYCSGHAEERVCCPHCGSMVLANMHPFRACRYFHTLYGASGLPRVDDAIAEAEKILRDALGDEHAF